MRYGLKLRLLTFLMAGCKKLTSCWRVVPITASSEVSLGVAIWV